MTAPKAGAPEQIARPVRVIVIQHDPSMGDDELAGHFGATFAGEVN